MEIARAVRYLSSGAGQGVLIAMTDPERSPDPEEVLHRLPGGNAMIWRAYGERADMPRIRRLSALARAKACVLLVAGHPQMGQRTGIDGLHLPERSLARHHEGDYVRGTVAYPARLVTTAACHSERAILAAARAGVGAVLISPVFATRSHPEARPLGIVRFARLARLAHRHGLLPYALGGVVTEAHIRRLRGTGAEGVAGIGLLIR